ncbi:hypothetical protein K458DRAFT_435626 [Lentithecium fluviatile CBS 122367]|uniref:Rhodopsin domain-containing protein n=1 Tax=Lentithecium fluviatile CBS 122367 TaxID=1168545 RepID=A0A6G1ILC6_9PLEO|nr:hypothetical protein K458DRAFT_435626 [Lentithecium fluviatile CBS 122367]
MSSDTSSPSMLPYENPGSGVNIAIWMCFITASLTVISKVLTKLPEARAIVKYENYHLDDAMCLCAILLATIQTVLVSQQVNAGLGQQYGDAKLRGLRKYDALGFASQLFYVLTVAVAKGTGVLFAMRLRPSRTYRLGLQTLMYTISAWTLVFFLGTAFQCQALNTWKYIDGKCQDQFAFWTAMESVNMLTDVVLTAALISIVGVLSVPLSKKLILVFAFATRILIIPAVAVRLHYLRVMYQTQHGPHWNPTFAEANVAIATSVAMSAAIIASCIPFLKPLVDSMQVGWSNSDVRQGLGFTVLYSKGSSASKLRSFSKGSVILNSAN